MIATSQIGGAHNLTASLAVLIYEDHEQAFATIHSIEHRPMSRPELGPGRCLTRDCLGELVRKMAGTSAVREILPENVICNDGTLMAWIVLQHRRPIFIKGQAVNGVPVVHPNLLFVAESGKLRVFALTKCERRPDLPIFRAPYFNLSDNGLMCRGNALYPDRISVSDILRWEAAFFETLFTHSNYRAKFTSHPQGHIGLWTYCADERISEFPNGYLVPAGFTLQEVLAT